MTNHATAPTDPAPPLDLEQLQREGMTVTYDYINEALRPIGGLKNILLMAPQFLGAGGELDPRVLEGIRTIIDSRMPLTITVNGKGFAFTAHIR